MPFFMQKNPKVETENTEAAVAAKSFFARLEPP